MSTNLQAAHHLVKPIPIINQAWGEGVVPLVSISCITYNHATFIREAMDGFLAQETTFPVEILIHDDASTDGTIEIIQGYEKKYPNLIRPIYQLKNQYSQGVRGMMVRFNFPRARGKYIALCEGDDYWIDPLKLQKQVEFMETNPEYIMCFTRFYVFDQKSGTTDVDLNEHYFEKGNIKIEFNFEKFLQGWYVGNQTLLIRGSALQKVLPKLVSYKFTRDVHMLTELLLTGKGVCLNFFSAVYRKHDGGVWTSSNGLQRARTGYLIYREIYYKNKKEQLLQLKFINFAKHYLNVLLESNSRFTSLIVVFDIVIIEQNYKILLYVLRKMLLSIKSSLLEVRRNIK